MSETPDLGKAGGEPPPEPTPPPSNPYEAYRPPSPYALSPTGVPYGPPPDHPSTSTVLILGILGLVLCQLLSPFAWVIGGRTVREIDASGGRLGGRSTANAGRICGIVGTVILVCYVVLFVVLVLVAMADSGLLDDDDYGLALVAAIR